MYWLVGLVIVGVVVVGVVLATRSRASGGNAKKTVPAPARKPESGLAAAALTTEASAGVKGPVRIYSGKRSTLVLPLFWRAPEEPDPEPRPEMLFNPDAAAHTPLREIGRWVGPGWLHMFGLELKVGASMNGLEIVAALSAAFDPASGPFDETFSGQRDEKDIQKLSTEATIPGGAFATIVSTFSKGEKGREVSLSIAMFNMEGIWILAWCHRGLPSGIPGMVKELPAFTLNGGFRMLPPN